MTARRSQDDQGPGREAADPAVLTRRTSLIKALGALAIMGGGRVLARSADAGAPPPTDDQPAIQAAVDRGDLLLPRRATPYRLRTPVRVPANRTVRIAAGAQIVYEGAPASDDKHDGVFDVRGDDVSIAVDGAGVATVRAATPDSWLYAVQGRGVSRLSVSGIMALDCQHVRTLARASDAWAQVSVPSDLCRSVKVTGGGARFAAVPGQGVEAACNMRYVLDWEVSGCTYDNVVHGVGWWGGNANPVVADGEAQNARKCGNFTIRDVIVRNAREAGIWGSMGHDGNIADCRVDRCGDVGFDAEGSTAIVFRNCMANNARNGCFAVFFLCRDVVFQDCTGHVSVRTFPLVRLWNATQSSAGTGRVAVLGGRFTCSDVAGPSSIDSANGPTAEFAIEQATLENVRIDTVSNNMHRTRIAGNRLSFPAGTSSFAAIRAGGSHLLGGTPGSVQIEENKITLAGSAMSRPGATGIALFEDDFNSSPSAVVRGNVVAGPFSVFVSAVNASRNTAMRPMLRVIDNVFQAPAARTTWFSSRATLAGARRPALLWRNNRDTAGRIVPDPT